MLHKTNCLNCPNKSKCFSHLSADELLRFNEFRTEISYKKGETIIKQGTFATHVLFIKSGMAKIYIEGHQKNLIVKLVKSGELIGLTSLFDIKFHNFTVVSLKDPTTVCLIEKKQFQTMVFENANFAIEVIKDLDFNITKIIRKLYCLSNKQLQHRMAEILLELSTDVYNSDNFELTLSRKDLSEMTSMAMENVVRILKDFKNSGLIELNGKQIKILEKQKLIEISSQS
ncbi:MAG: hypothetical protein DRP35_09305 [Candidatus Zixiibacteriota bacterium]|nr:MAG: hypothetical protein DRP35_09305 [candidate division Zixibacteria bacterium]